jgi:hypothetical protein
VYEDRKWSYVSYIDFLWRLINRSDKSLIENSYFFCQLVYNVTRRAVREDPHRRQTTRHMQMCYFKGPVSRLLSASSVHPLHPTTIRSYSAPRIFCHPTGRSKTLLHEFMNRLLVGANFYLRRQWFITSTVAITSFVRSRPESWHTDHLAGSRFVHASLNSPTPIVWWLNFDFGSCSINSGILQTRCINTVAKMHIQRLFNGKM